MMHRNRVAGFTSFELFLVMSVLTMAGLLSVIAIGQAQAILEKIQNRQGIWRERYRLSKVFREDIHLATHFSLRDPHFLEIYIGENLVNYAVEGRELVRQSASRVDRFSLGTSAHLKIEHDRQVWVSGEDFEIVAVASPVEPAR